MQHDFDYLTEAFETSVADAENEELPNAISMGPDADEVWDVLDLFVQVRASFAAATDDLARAAVWWQVDTAEELLVSGRNVEDFTDERSPRVLDAGSGFAESMVLDTSNGVGAGGKSYEMVRDYRFDHGDLRIAYPGEIDLGLALENDLGGGVSELDVHVALAAHYEPSPRHG